MSLTYGAGGPWATVSGHHPICIRSLDLESTSSEGLFFFVTVVVPGHPFRRYFENTAEILLTILAIPRPCEYNVIVCICVVSGYETMTLQRECRARALNKSRTQNPVHASE